MQHQLKDVSRDDADRNNNYCSTAEQGFGWRLGARLGQATQATDDHCFGIPITIIIIAFWLGIFHVCMSCTRHDDSSHVKGILFIFNAEAAHYAICITRCVHGEY